MIDVVLDDAWVLYCINKDEGDESQPVIAFQGHFFNSIFLKYSKIIFEPFRNLKYPI